MFELLRSGIKDSSFGLVKHLSRSAARRGEFLGQFKRILVEVRDKIAKPVDVECDGDTVIVIVRPSFVHDDSAINVPFGPLLDAYFKWNVLEECFAGDWSVAAAKLAPQLPEGIAIEPDMSFIAKIDYQRRSFVEREQILKDLLTVSMSGIQHTLIRGMLSRSNVIFNSFAEKCSRILVAYGTGKNTLSNGVLTLGLPSEALRDSKFEFGGGLEKLIGLKCELVMLKLKLLSIKFDVPLAFNFDHIEQLRDGVYEAYLEGAVKLVTANVTGLKGRGDFTQIVFTFKRGGAGKLCMAAHDRVLEVSFDASIPADVGTTRTWRECTIVESSQPIAVPNNREELFPERVSAGAGIPLDASIMASAKSLSISSASVAVSATAVAAPRAVPSPPRSRAPSLPPGFRNPASATLPPAAAAPTVVGNSNNSPPPVRSAVAPTSPRSVAAPTSPRVVSPPAQKPPPTAPAPNSSAVELTTSADMSLSRSGVTSMRVDAKIASGWSAAEVAQWLRDDLQLASAADLFAANEVDGATLMDLSADDLKGIGVTQLGVWKKILRERDQMKSKTKIAMSGDMIPDDHLELVKRIGGGHFGEVWVAKWNSLTDVAVKWLLTENANVEFLAEVQVLQKVRHPHVIETFGVSMDKDSRLRLVTELLDTSLLAYLRESFSHDNSDLVEISIQVCKAGVHLAKHGVVHRDLAARNILLKLGGRVPLAKICDFGLGKVMEENYYMVSTPGVPLPLKWTAPEAMEKKTFSEKSDVWSFGIVLFEIFSHGSDPYLGWNPKLILQQLREGERLARPAECPVEVYQIMLQCWQLNRNDRPNFAALYASFFALQNAQKSQSSPNGRLADSTEIGGAYEEPEGVGEGAYLEASI